MKAAVIVFPGSNCDRDVQVSLRHALGADPHMVWHADSDLPAGTDLIVIPGGFSYGDYLRCGAISAQSAIMGAIKKRAGDGALVLGICNGFQVLTESGLLPGVLMRNANLKFVCRDIHMRVEATGTAFTSGYTQGQVIRIPVAHHDGNYVCDAETLSRIEGEGQEVFRYVDADGVQSPGSNPNGSMNDIAGVTNAGRNVLGLMPHPERLADPMLGGTDGKALFDALAQRLMAA